MVKFSRKWKAYQIAQEIALFIEKHGICEEASLLLASVQDIKTKKYAVLWLYVLL